MVSPYFPEYRTWIEAAGCTIVEVPAAVPSFQPDIEALRAAIGAEDERRDHQHAEQPGGRRVHPREP